MENNENLKKALNFSLENVDLSNKILKALEELGELARVYLKLNNSANSTAGILDNKNLKEDLLEEALDVYLVVLDIINSIKEEYNFPQEYIDNILNKKVNKWLDKFENV